MISLNDYCPDGPFTSELTNDKRTFSRTTKGTDITRLIRSIEEFKGVKKIYTDRRRSDCIRRYKFKSPGQPDWTKIMVEVLNRIFQDKSIPAKANFLWGKFNHIYITIHVYKKTNFPQ